MSFPAPKSNATETDPERHGESLRWDDVGPETKLEPVLATWPHLELTLVALSPTFRALEDPLLRKTFAKAATLRQVAQAAGMGAESLLAAFDAAVRGAEGASPAPPSPTAPAAEPPAWTRRAPAGGRDARVDVARGEHPLPKVLADLEGLPNGEVYELITPMIPAPLLGLLERKGFEAYAALDGSGFARTVVRRRPG